MHISVYHVLAVSYCMSGFPHFPSIATRWFGYTQDRRYSSTTQVAKTSFSSLKALFWAPLISLIEPVGNPLLSVDREIVYGPGCTTVLASVARTRPTSYLSWSPWRFCSACTAGVGEPRIGHCRMCEVGRYVCDVGAPLL